ncbi:MAG: hypothetical protein WC477_00060 [Patescibacteria group bacterium]
MTDNENATTENEQVRLIATAAELQDRIRQIGKNIKQETRTLQRLQRHLRTRVEDGETISGDPYEDLICMMTSWPEDFAPFLRQYLQRIAKLMEKHPGGLITIRRKEEVPGHDDLASDDERLQVVNRYHVGIIHGSEDLLPCPYRVVDTSPVTLCFLVRSKEPMMLSSSELIAINNDSQFSDFSISGDVDSAHSTEIYPDENYLLSVLQGVHLDERAAFFAELLKQLDATSLPEGHLFGELFRQTQQEALEELFEEFAKDPKASDLENRRQWRWLSSYVHNAISVGLSDHVFVRQVRASDPYL